MEYTYQASDLQGRIRTGRLTAADAQAAFAVLQKQGLYPLKITEAAEPITDRDAGFPKGTEIALFTQQLAALLASGIPLDGCLRTIVGVAAPGPLRKLTSDLAKRVEAGEGLAEAMGHYPRVFSKLYVSMVRAGEAGGALEAVLARLSEFTQQQGRLRNQILLGLLYPIILLGVSLAAVIFLLLFVIPKFQVMLLQTGQSLPVLTQLILDASQVITRFWWVFPLGMALVVLGVRAYLATARGRRQFDAWYLRLPLLGPLGIEIILVNLTRTLGLLLQSGVQLLPGLLIVEAGTANVVAAEALAQVREGVERGAPFGRELRATGVFPSIAMEMVMVGEQAGNLEEMLLRVANIYETRVQERIRAYLAFLEPVIVLIMAGIVLIVVLAVILPVLSLNVHV